MGAHPAHREFFMYASEEGRQRHLQTIVIDFKKSVTREPCILAQRLHCAHCAPWCKLGRSFHWARGIDCERGEGEVSRTSPWSSRCHVREPLSAHHQFNHLQRSRTPCHRTKKIETTWTLAPMPVLMDPKSGGLVTHAGGKRVRPSLIVWVHN